MALAILQSTRVILQAFSRDLGSRAKTEIAKLALSVVATGLLLSAGVVALTQVVGYPIAAVLCGSVFCVLAVVVHLIGRRKSIRQSQRLSAAQNRMQADIALMTSIARSTLPLLPIVAFLAAFSLARRR